MKKIVLLAGLIAAGVVPAESVKLVDWEFRRGESAWKRVTVPHDWAIAGPFDKDIDKQVIRIKENQEKKATEKTGRTGSLPWIGSGEYRRKLAWPAGATNARLYFHGVMSEPKVFLGGERIGGWKNGYAPFSVELKKFEGEKELLVKVTNREESSRWYPGAGIYREVELKWNEKVRPEDVQIVTDRIEGNRAFMRVVSSAGTRTFTIDNPKLWTPETPHLYTLEPEGIRYGVRTIEYGADFFKLNGVKRKFKGVCLHHDLGPFGAAFDEWAFRRQVTLLKEMGCDSIRTSHNIPAPRQLDICDEMGMMVMAESFDAWEMAKVKNGYNLFFADWWRRDLEALVRMARNHPSVVMWSIGNEVTDQTKPRGAELTRQMQDFIHSLDGEKTRLVTQGASWMPHAIKSGVIAAMEIPAVTYRLPFYEAIHAVDPKKPMLGAETASTVSSRGIYKFPIDENAKCRAYDDGQCSGYDTECCVWSNLPDDDWAMQDDHPWTIGEFIWTGFDYLGEPTPYDTYWPSRSSYFGAIDLAGLPKDRFYLYRSRWNEKEHTVKICPAYWNFPGREGKVTPVYVYTDGVEGELFLNGKSLGRVKKNPASRLDRYRLRWNNVVYAPGELKVIAYDKSGKRIGEDVLRTAGAFDRFKEESRTFGPYVFTTVTAVDKAGNLCPYYDGVYEVKCARGYCFKCICNGDATSLESFVEPRMKLFRGQLVYVTEKVEEVKSAFMNPPRDAWPQVWFHWNGDGVTREALTKDIEAIAAAGFRRAIVIVPQMMQSPIKVKMMSEEWLSIFDFALSEAKRCGITLGVHNCPGWSSSGGPWITPENSMKIVVSSVKDLKGGEAAGLLPQPRTNRGFYRDIATVAFPIDPVPAAKCSVELKHTIPLASDPKDGYAIEWDFAEAFRPTAATLAFQEGNVNTLAVVEGSQDGAKWTELGRVEHHFIMNPPNAPKTLALKAASSVKKIRIRFFANEVPEWQGGKFRDIILTSVAFDTAPMYASSDIRTSASDRDVRYVKPSNPAAKGIALEDLIDLTAKTDAEGNLDWVAPVRTDGRVWRVLRLGYTSSGKTCAPSTLSGLECDKLSKKGIDAHWQAMPAKLLALPHAKGTLDYMLIDSWEVSGQNWTEGFADEFQRDRGYSLKTFLPIYAGYVIDSADTTAKVLYDLQRVVSNLICENYYARFAELCRKAGIVSSTQAYGGPFDVMDAGSKADEPEGEYWYFHTDPCGGEYGGISRVISSIAHLNGRRIASSESFTSGEKEGRWQMTPAQLRRLGDYRWMQGINRFTVHSYLHQPWDVKPGLSLQRHGSQLNRYTTWWPEASAWTDYLKRGQALLQSGAPEADVLVLRGEGCMAETGDHQDVVAAGYSFDFCATVNLMRLENRGHEVAVRGLSNSYPVLFIGRNSCLSVAELRKIAALAKGGARIAGGRPTDTPTHLDDPSEWKRLVGELWDGGLVRNENDLPKALRGFGVAPCCNAEGQLMAIRRKLENGGKIFFVRNNQKKPFRGKVRFEADGQGAIFDAVSGAVRPFDGTLSLDAYGSAFVVFGVGDTEGRLAADCGSSTDISSDWTIVSFKGNEAPSAPLSMAKLVSWSESSDTKLKYFSGRALYEKTIDLSDAVGREVTLDLGEVHDVATVYVDGKRVTTLWCKPYRVQFKVESKSVRLGVEVVNTWPNRLIGDAIIRKEKGREKLGKCDFPQWVLDRKERGENGVTTWSNFHWAFKADEPLRPAGLLGPVVLFGAGANVRKTETKRIQDEIDRVSANGGGRVVIGKGVHPCGTLYLKSGVELHLEEGAVLLGGEKSEDYDDAIPLHNVYSYSNNHSNTVTRKAFIYAENATNIAITGKGVIDGQGTKFFDQSTVLWGYFWAKPSCMRPRMVVFMNCKGIRFEDTTFKDSPVWTMWLRHCEDIVASRIRVVAVQKIINSDGIDFDACRNVRVGDSYFKTGDDCIVLRAIRYAADADREVVTENVVVSNCYLNSACQGVRIGCPSDDLIRNAVFKNMKFEGNNAIYCDQEPQYLKPGDKGSIRTKDILFEDWNISCRGFPISATIRNGVTLKDFGHMTFRNICIDSRNPVRVCGNQISTVKDVLVEGLTTPRNTLPRIATNFTDNVRVVTKTSVGK